MVDLVKEKEVLDIMADFPESMHLILTGRGASPAVIDRSDLVTEMKEIKHPFQNDEPPVEGIDY
jgi:cob(I)alamin adenosyltransferase